MNLNQALVRTGTCRPDVKGSLQADRLCKGERTDAGHRGGVARSRVEGAVMVLDQRGDIVQLCCVGNLRGRTCVDKARPFCIEKREVWEAYKRVKANRGAAGVDGQSIAEFEEDLSNNLYRIWSRMSSAVTFPPAVLRVEIPKDNGAGVRPLGI